MPQAHPQPSLHSRPGSSQRVRSNTDFSNHTWVPVPDTGISVMDRELISVQFFDETEDISRIMSAPSMPSSNSLTSSPPQVSGSQGDAMDYESIFSPFN